MASRKKPATSTDYSPFLHVSENGRIWWRLEDAIKLGAGFLPISDDERSLVPALAAPSNRVRANERELLGAVSREYANVVPPQVLGRDDGRYVEAHDFLTWLSQYLTVTQADLPFPKDLMAAVRSADSARSAPPVAARFESLTSALEGLFEKALAELPEAQRGRIKADLSLGLWDDLTPVQRLNWARQWDAQHDPALEDERKYWWDHFVRKRELESQLSAWSEIDAPSASELAHKELRIAELQRDIDAMEAKQRLTRGDVLRQRNLQRGQAPDVREASVGYIAYPRALKMLAERLDATPEEMAVWVWIGPKEGGLSAYLNANELEDPPQFFYTFTDGSPDFLAPLMACWFRSDDIAGFLPKERFITGAELVKRWGAIPGIRPAPFIQAKIAESRLLDMHPIFGGTQGSNPGETSFPPLTDGLFSLAEIAAIEAEDFGQEEGGLESRAISGPTCSAEKIKHYFVVVRSSEADNRRWWSSAMRNALDNGLHTCRVGAGKKGPGGSLWLPVLVSQWLIDRYTKGKTGLSPSQAKVALKKVDGCSDIAEEIFASDG